MEHDILRAKLKKENTESRPCVVFDTPDAHTVWLKVGVQQFCVTNEAMETEVEADWMRDMLAEALATLIEQQGHNVEVTGCASRSPG